MSIRSAGRALAITAGFCCAGAIQGAITGVLSWTPIWVEELIRPPQHPLLGWWALSAIIVIGAPIGILAGPVVGWTLLGRAPVWRILVEPTIGAVAGSWAALLYLYLAQATMGGTTHLVVGAALGAAIATARLRIRSPTKATETVASPHGGHMA